MTEFGQVENLRRAIVRILFGEPLGILADNESLPSLQVVNLTRQIKGVGRLGADEEHAWPHPRLVGEKSNLDPSVAIRIASRWS